MRRFRPEMGEGFVYDDLDRLTSWSEIDQETGQAPTGGFNVSYTYDESGNLRNRVATSGVGAQSLAQKYDGSGNAGPHAITSSAEDIWYLYADQLGSTDATEGGDVTQVRQDPFGNKITGQAGAWDVRLAAAAAGPPGAEAVTRGFTGHEE